MANLYALPDFDSIDIDEAIQHLTHLDADDRLVIFATMESVGHADMLKQMSNKTAEATIDAVKPDDDAVFCKTMYAICIICGMLIYKNKTD